MQSGMQRMAIIFVIAASAWRRTEEDLNALFDSGGVSSIVTCLVDGGPARCMLVENDLYVEHAMMISILDKCIPKLTRDRVQKLFGGKIVEFAVGCLKLVGKYRKDKIIAKAVVYISRLTSQIAAQTIGKQLLVDAGTFYI